MNPVRKLLTVGVPRLLLGSFLAVGLLAMAWKCTTWQKTAPLPVNRQPSSYAPRPVGNDQIETSGIAAVYATVEPWGVNASLAEIGRRWQRVGYHGIELLDAALANSSPTDATKFHMLVKKASLYHYEGEPRRAYQVLEQLRSQVESDDYAAHSGLYSVIYFQGVTALRCGETENCVMCRGESSCIIPISPAAVHINPEGSRLAIRHFSEYLAEFPDDIEVKWLLNLAHMTLGEHPHLVDPRFLVSLDHFTKSEFDIGKFRDIGHVVGVNRLNQAGGAIMEDFDNDGLLDIAATTWDPSGAMVFYRNNGKGAFEDCTEAAGLSGQLGGLYCVQTDYNNDGYMDIFIPRGAWLSYPVRPSLLRNNGNGTFSDVTIVAGLLDPVNSNSASWADYDNDGWLDLFICCERQPNRLYHNMRNGKFDEVAAASGVDGYGLTFCKGSAWIDFDNDGYQDLFLNYLTPREESRLFRNNRKGAFVDVTSAMGIAGPAAGFSCWAWDYDNDGWLDLFATCYDRTLGDMVKGLLGEPHNRLSNRLYHNQQGRGFEDRTNDAGLDVVLVTMGSNFGDFDNDGFLDMYLGTGEPGLEFLDPSRMFKNVGGRRFAEITGTSGTGNLQKGHAVACGDWDRDGNTDIFIEMGGITNGDRYHNILFQNPGQGNHWLTVKLVGQKTNRAAIGARIKVVTAGEKPLTVYRNVSSGSSFGANSLQQTIGLAQAGQIAELEIHWPTSGTTQVFRDLAVDQAIEVTEFAEEYKKLAWQPIPIAK
jgi:hypothetical protein